MDTIKLYFIFWLIMGCGAMAAGASFLGLFLGRT
jgi:hypothetical protein